MPSPRTSLPRWLVWPGAALFAGSLAAFLALARIGGYDFSVYLLGGEAFRSGQPVYDQQIHSQWGAGYFTYPPVTLLLFGPMSSLPYPVAYVVMFTVEIGVLLVVAGLALRLLGYRYGTGTAGAVLAAAAAALWLQPVFDSIHEGKLELILMALVLADFALDHRRRWPTGVLIGVAAALKITPGIFILYLLLIRRYRAAAVAAGTWAALTALGFATAWSDSVRFWFQGTFADADRVASPLAVDSVLNQSLRAVVVRLFGGAGAETGSVLLTLLVAAGGLAVAVRAHRRHSPLAGVLAAALTGLLISPVSWHEHWVWMLPVLILLADAGRWIRRGPALAVSLALLPGAVFLAWPLPTGEPGRWAPASILSPANHAWFDEGSRNPVIALAGAAYVLAGAVLLAAAHWLPRGQLSDSRQLADPAAQAGAQAGATRLDLGPRPIPPAETTRGEARLPGRG